MGYAATSAMSTIDGDTMRNARRRSERPLERRCVCCGGAASVTEVVASAMTIDQKVANALSIASLAFFIASCGDWRPARASLTLL